MGTGNGAPKGAHYNLNIIGVPKGKTMSSGSGNVIFVPETGSTKILLSEGPFDVLDKNGTDGSAAFQLPNPDPENDGTTTYSVLARALGKPGGSSKTTTCATEVATGEVYCSIYSMVLVREKGKSTLYQRVARASLHLCRHQRGRHAGALQSLQYGAQRLFLAVRQRRFETGPASLLRDPDDRPGPLKLRYGLLALASATEAASPPGRAVWHTCREVCRCAMWQPPVYQRNRALAWGTPRAQADLGHGLSAEAPAMNEFRNWFRFALPFMAILVFTALAAEAVR